MKITSSNGWVIIKLYHPIMNLFAAESLPVICFFIYNNVFNKELWVYLVQLINS